MAKIEFDLTDPRPVLLAVRSLLDDVLAPEAKKQSNSEKADISPEPEPSASSTTTPSKDGDLGNESEASTASHDAEGAHDVTDTDEVAVDPNGVPFSSDMCAKATDPFYGSGPRKGQWKKKRGVSDDDYDNWYADQLDAIADSGDAVEPEDTDVAAAFGAAAAEEPADRAPSTAGEFMGWVASQQAAGHLSQDQVGLAYQQAGVAVPDLFPPNTPDDVAASIRKVYDILNGFL